MESHSPPEIFPRPDMRTRVLGRLGVDESLTGGLIRQRLFR